MDLNRLEEHFSSLLHGLHLFPTYMLVLMGGYGEGSCIRGDMGGGLE